MFNPTALLDQFLAGDSGQTLQKGKEYLSNNAGSLAGGAALGGLGGYMLGSKKGRKVAKKAATYGGVALLAGLAYKAYSNYKNPVQSAAQERLPQRASFEINSDAGGQSFSATLISAMIAAAKADGQIDASEQQAIFAKIEELNIDNDDKAFLLDQLNQPMDIDRLVDAASNKEQAVEIYVASIMAINIDTQAEKAYLLMLAARLGLEEALVAEIHKTVEAELS